MVRSEILRMLLDGEDFISGQNICSNLGVSRTAVWKAIESLRSEGFEIESKTNQGYRLTNVPDMLIPDTILPHISTKKLCKEIICLDKVESTNTYLKTLAAQGADEGTVVIADCQTAGRGRMGRSFLSPSGKGIYLSILMRPDFPPSKLLALTSIAAVAICEALEEVADIKTGIKWVNDIIAGEKKVCGILTEMSVLSESGQIDYVVVGAGVNVHQVRDDFPDEVLQKATSLAMLGHEGISRPKLAAAIINSLDRMYDRLPDPGEKFWENYRERSITVGRQIKVLKGENEVDAFAQDVIDGGNLLVRYPDGKRETLGYGEVSIRGKYGYV